jgi:hypothetical protein
MSRRILALAAALIAIPCLPRPASAETGGRLRLEVLVDGRTLREYPARGTTYVEARRGHEYAVRVTNLEPVRVAVALAVDGRNTIDAKRTSAADARKWILEPWQSIVIDGWQVDEATARHFFFTTEDRSYAQWLGDTANTGLIEAVAFREVEHRQAWNESPWWWGGRKDGDERSASREEPQAGAPAPSMKSQSSARDSSGAVAQAQESDELAATGIGRDVRHDVERVDFEQESSPSSSVRVRYEYREELISLGVLPDERPTWNHRETARGFTDSWCPEPPRGR